MSETLGELPFGESQVDPIPRAITLKDVMARDNAAFFNTRDFATTAAYYPEGSVAYYINGVMERRPSITGEQEAAELVFRCATNSVLRARQSDEILIDAVRYYVIRVDKNENGETDIYLSLQQNEFASA